MTADRPLFLGIDFGTSGCRARVVDASGCDAGAAAVALHAPSRPAPGWSEQDPAVWWNALAEVLGGLPRDVRAGIAAAAIDGTSGTLLLADAAGRPLGPALLYDDARAVDQARRLAGTAPAHAAVHSPSSSLAKALWLLAARPAGARHLLHQADWILGCLTGRFGMSDENNALKLGYDPVARCWPAWLAGTGLPPDLLPEVRPVGTAVGTLAPAVAAGLGLSPDVLIVTGTTDSMAGAIAAGVAAIGDGVTTLGSTLVVKVLSERPVFAPVFGVYSHRLGERWLVGGASNSGGAVLRRFFGDAELAALSAHIDPAAASGLDYYPLLRPGERFPFADPGMAPRLEPVPADRAAFLHGLLEGMARIEALGYRRLVELGAPYPARVLTTGGGAGNPAWAAIRARLLGVPVTAAEGRDAARGAALLARDGHRTAAGG